MPEVYGDPRIRSPVRGERQHSDKENCIPNRGQRQQQGQHRRRRLDSGSREGGNPPTPAGTATTAGEAAERIGEAESGEEETAAETAAGISRARALAAAGDLLVAV